MCKLKITMLMIIIICILSSCSLGGSRVEMLNNSNDEENAKMRLEQVIESIENRDKEGIKVLFSEKALYESDDFNKTAEVLFDFIEGKIESIKKLSGSTVSESIDHGNKVKKVISYYYVTTDVQEYFFMLEDYPIDTEHPNNVGLSLLLVVKAEDEEKIWDDNNKIIYDKIIENGEEKLIELYHIGIYLPIID